MNNPFGKEAIITILIPNRKTYEDIEVSLRKYYGDEKFIQETIDISIDPIVAMIKIQKTSITIIEKLKKKHTSCRFLRSKPTFKRPGLITLCFSIYGSIGITIGIIKTIFS